VAKVRKVPCLVYSRVVGFLTATQYWNAGKKAEWKDRKTYTPPGVSALAAREGLKPSEAPPSRLPEQRVAHKDSDMPLTFVLRGIDGMT